LRILDLRLPPEPPLNSDAVALLFIVYFLYSDLSEKSAHGHDPLLVLFYSIRTSAARTGAS